MILIKAIVLLSGGIDSSTCIPFYLNLGYEVECVFCDYGQPAKLAEFNAAKLVTDYYHVPLKTITTSNIIIPSVGEICGRNAMLVLQAYCLTGFGTYKIILGIHSGTDYFDCSEVFLRKLNDIIDCYTKGTVYIEAPFLTWSKADIVEYAKNNNVPLKLTYSCSASSDIPCGKCPSCLERKALLNESF